MSNHREERHTGGPVEFTAQFLTEVLRDAGYDLTVVRSVRLERLGGRDQFNAQVMRLHLQYEREPSGAPKTLIAKLPKGDQQLNERAQVFVPGVREGWFYRRAAAASPISTPRCYVSMVDPAGQSVLLLEDIHPAHVGSWKKGLNLLQAKLALDTAARLHAFWWEREDDPAIQELRGVVNKNAADELALVIALYADAWPRFCTQYGALMTEELRRFGGWLGGHLQAAEGLLAGSPRTLVHGDFRTDNLLITVRDGQADCWVIDWEDCFFGNGLEDVAWLLGGGLTKKEVKEEAGLLERYFLGLISNGVQGYSWEQCLDDYRRAMCGCFVQGVLSAVSAPQAGKVIAERFTAAAKRLELWDLIL